MSFGYKRNTTDSFTVDGVLSSDNLTITYETKEGQTIVVPLMKYLEQFDSQTVKVSVKTVRDEELYLPSEE